MMYQSKFLLKYPFLKLQSSFRPKAQGVLLIQTSDVCAYLNTSCVFESCFKKFGKFDMIIDSKNLEFAKFDERIGRKICIDELQNENDEMRLAMEIFARNYAEIYIFSPTNLTLFLAKMAFCKDVKTISHYNNPSEFNALSKGFKIFQHSRNSALEQSFLSMFDSDKNLENYKKSPQKPIFTPSEPIINSYEFKIGISLDLDKKCSIPPQTWDKIFKILADFDAEIYIFGSDEEENAILELINTHGARIKHVAGKIKTHELPYYLGLMNVYIGAENPAYHIADSVGVPCVCLIGLGSADEIEGSGKNLIIYPQIASTNGFFDDRNSNHDTNYADKFFEISDADCQNIADFIQISLD